MSNTFENADFSASPLPPGDYELVSFTNCTVTKGDLSRRIFYDCTFTNCTLDGVNLTMTGLREATFIDCQLTGVVFDRCDPFLMDVSFTRCVLTNASFAGLTLKRTQFTGCTLHNTNFAHTDLRDSLFDDCDLKGAIFDQTNLEKADFRTARHYALDPERNRIKKARFAWPGLVGLLIKYGVKIG